MTAAAQLNHIEKEPFYRFKQLRYSDNARVIISKFV